MSEAVERAAASRADRRPGPARGRSRDRARHAARRAVHRPAARRHGRRDRQDRAAGPARPDARVGPGALRGPLALVAGAVAEQEVLHAEPARPSAARSCCSSSPSTATSSSRTSAPARSRAGTSGPERLWEVNPGLVIARISGYGQTGRTRSAPASPRSPEAMGGIRYINGFPDEPPPRIHISLGDSLAGMFAVQGILAALYRRDALGGGRGQVIDVSLMEACFALLESTVPEYDRLGIVRGPGGTGLKGVAPSNIFKSQRRQVDGDRRERGQGLRAALRGDGAARARRRRAVRDASRARREPGGARGDRRRVGARAHRRRDRPRS